LYVRRGYLQNKTGASNILDHRKFIWSVYLAAQSTHLYVHQICGGNKFIIPDFSQKHGTRQQLVAMTHHVFEQAEFSWSQLDRTLATLGASLDKVEFQTPHPPYGVTYPNMAEDDRLTRASILAIDIAIVLRLDRWHRWIFFALERDDVVRWEVALRLAATGPSSCIA
jgi:hypothetical protein